LIREESIRRSLRRPGENERWRKGVAGRKMEKNKIIAFTILYLTIAPGQHILKSKNNLNK